MCFAPQRRALFRHLNLQKWSEPLVLLTFCLRHMLRATTACTFSTSEPPKVVRTPGVFNMLFGNMLRATTACTFSTSQLPKVVRECCVFYILTWKCASHHNGVHFFDISTAKSGPRPLSVFVHFWLGKCASRHNGVHFFDISTSKSGPKLVCFCTFWLAHVLRATMACNFHLSSGQLAPHPPL